MKKRSTKELAGTAELALEEKGRASEGAAGGAAGGSRAGENWRSVGDVAGALMERLRAAAGDGLGGTGVNRPRRQHVTLH